MASSSAYRSCQELRKAEVFERLWQKGLLKSEELNLIDWSWLSMDGALKKAPRRVQKTGRNPTDRSKQGVKRSLLTDTHGLLLAIVINGVALHSSCLFSWRRKNRDRKLRRETSSSLAYNLIVWNKNYIYNIHLQKMPSFY